MRSTEVTDSSEEHANIGFYIRIILFMFYIIWLWSYGHGNTRTNNIFQFDTYIVSKNIRTKSTKYNLLT